MNGPQSQRSEPGAKDKVSFREGTVADANAISALFRGAFAEFKPLYTAEAFVATVLPEPAVFARLQEGPLWVAEKHTQVIGTVAAICRPDSVLVRGMAVDPKARSSGVGKALLSLTERFAREHGYDQLCLYTSAFLRQAIHLYEASGFHFTGETANPHGTELLRMVKLLAVSPNGEAARR
jgi:GNAT superfamily N-acetyltransferase